LAFATFSFGGYGLAVTDWRLRRWRLWFLGLSNAPQKNKHFYGETLMNEKAKNNQDNVGRIDKHVFIWWDFDERLSHTA